MEGYDRDNNVRVIVLTGKGRAFSAGADIDEMTSDNPISLELLKPICGLGPIGIN